MPETFSFIIRFIHVISVGLLLGGSVLLWWLSFRTRERDPTAISEAGGRTTRKIIAMGVGAKYRTITDPSNNWNRAKRWNVWNDWNIRHPEEEWRWEEKERKQRTRCI